MHFGATSRNLSYIQKLRTTVCEERNLRERRKVRFADKRRGLRTFISDLDV